MFISYYDINDNEIKRFHFNDWVVMSNKLIVGMYAETITHKVIIETTNSVHRNETRCNFTEVAFECYAHYDSTQDDNAKKFRGSVNHTIVNEYTYCRVYLKE